MESDQLIEAIAYGKYQEGTNPLDQNARYCINSLGLAIGYYRYIEDTDGALECIAILRMMEVDDEGIKRLERKGYDNALRLTKLNDEKNNDSRWEEIRKELEELLEG